MLDDKRSVSGAKDQFARNCGSVVVATVATACGGSWSGNFKDAIVVDTHVFQQVQKKMNGSSCGSRFALNSWAVQTV